LEAGVGHVTLASAETGNALDRDLLEQFQREVMRARSETGCRVIVVNAEGREFSIGFDLSAVKAGENVPALARLFASCLLSLTEADQPVLACVEGRASGGAVGLIAACDIVLAADAAEFMLPEVIVGMIPSLITPVLRRRLPLARIRYLALSSRAVHAIEAMQFGLVDEVVGNEMQAALKRQVGRLKRSSPRALAECKQRLLADDASELRHQLEAAINRLVIWLQDDEVREGVARFGKGLAPPWFSSVTEENNVGTRDDAET
jgi:enoyl-CoA hydratase/carnithine racemase